MEDQTPIDELIARFKIPIIVGLVGLVLLIGGMFSSGLFSSFSKPTKQFAKTSNQPQIAVQVTVDVSGAVVNPGVYSLPAGSRIEEAIKSAGGVSEDVDPAYLAKTINLAQKIADGMKIYIPSSQESFLPGSVTTSSNVASAQKTVISINSSSLEELDKLPGVGPTTAQSIIDKRPYENIEDLLIKKVVTRATFEKIKALVSLY